MNVPDLQVQVVEVKGHCPVYRVGDDFRVQEGYKLQTKQAAVPACFDSIASLLRRTQ